MYTSSMLRTLFLAGGLILLTACEKSDNDPCADVTCQNGGTCLEGKCQCPTGYTGTNCEMLATPKAINVTGISIVKYPANKTDGSKWDADGSTPDLYPAIYTLKSDNKTIDQVFWASNNFVLNPVAGKSVDFNLVLPALSLTPVDKFFAIAAADKDDSGVELVGTVITFAPTSLIGNRPNKLTISCPTCTTGFELKVEYVY